MVGHKCVFFFLNVQHLENPCVHPYIVNVWHTDPGGNLLSLIFTESRFPVT